MNPSPLPASRRPTRSGSALLLTIVALAIAVPLVAVAWQFTDSKVRLGIRERDRSAATAACDGALEYAFGAWKGWVRANNYARPNATQCNATITTAAAQAFLTASAAFRGAVVTNLAVTPVDAKDAAVATPVSVKIPHPKRPWLATRSWLYRAEARVFTPSAAGDLGSAIKARESGNTALSVLTNGRRYVESRITRYNSISEENPWQAMMWYDGDLELFPTPEMTVYGWVHSNANIYLCHANNSNNLHMLSGLTLTGNSSSISEGTNSTITDPRGLIYGVSYWVEYNEPHWVNWKTPLWDSGGYSNQVDFLTEKLSPIPGTFAFDATDANPNNDSLREIIERPADTNGDGRRTAADDSDVRLAERRLYSQADLKIIVNRTAASAGNRIRLLDKNDNAISTANGTWGGNFVNRALGKNATTGLPNTKFLYDYREAGNVNSSSAAAAYTVNGNVTVTNINVQEMTNILSAWGDYVNGIVYFKDESTTNTTASGNLAYRRATGKRAARLVRGGTLPPLGMTFVTEDGVYIQGDYNTGSTWSGSPSTTDADGTLATQPASNSGTPTSNTVSGYEPKPAAVIGDAVMFLSNSWSDSYSNGTATNSRSASSTTYNTAFMSGDVATDTTGNVNRRSGGGINFPRVLENWNSNRLTYYGSMVQMYPSQMFNTPWVQYIYTAPTRPWYYQDRFLDQPPPGNLSSFAFARGRYTRS